MSSAVSSLIARAGASRANKRSGATGSSIMPSPSSSSSSVAASSSSSTVASGNISASNLTSAIINSGGSSTKQGPGVVENSFTTSLPSGTTSSRKTQQQAGAGVTAAGAANQSSSSLIITTTTTKSAKNATASNSSSSSSSSQVINPPANTQSLSVAGTGTTETASAGKSNVTPTGLSLIPSTSNNTTQGTTAASTPSLTTGSSSSANNSSGGSGSDTIITNSANNSSGGGKTSANTTSGSGGPCDKFQPQLWKNKTCKNCLRTLAEHEEAKKQREKQLQADKQQQAEKSSSVPEQQQKQQQLPAAITTPSIKSITPTAAINNNKTTVGSANKNNLPDIVSTVQSEQPSFEMMMAETSSGGSKQTNGSPKISQQQQQSSTGGVITGSFRQHSSSSTSSGIASDLRTKLDQVTSKCEQVLQLNEELLKQLSTAQQTTGSSNQTVASKFGSTLKSKFGSDSSKQQQQQQQQTTEPSLVVKELQEQLKRIRETAAQLSDEGRQLTEAVVQCDLARSGYHANESPAASPRVSSHHQSTVDLLGRLATAEDLCRSLRDENEQLKEEMEYVRLEIDEVRDRVRDEEGREFGELQKELDIAAKNCRILQFKLRKAERKIEVAESEKSRLEEQLRLHQRRDSKDENLYLRELEEELRVAKEVSVRLHDELELAEERRAKFEIDGERLRALLRQADQERVGLEKEVEGLRKQIERVQGHLTVTLVDAQTQSLPVELAAMMSPVSSGSGSGGRLLVRSATADQPASMHGSMHGSPAAFSHAGRQGSFDSEWSELKRDLCDSLEREQDLREQLKYAEEQIKSLRKKLNDFEEENESLIMQVKRLMNRNKQTQQKDSSSTADDVQQLHLDLSEQEVRILKRKLEAAERQNESLFGQVKELQSKLQVISSQHSLSPGREGSGEAGDRKGTISPTSGNLLEKQLSGEDDDRVALREKLTELTREADDLRCLLMEKETEMQALLDLPATATSDVKAVHFKRQLDLLRQETLLLRDKITKQEAEKTQLHQQNQRLAIQVASSSPTSAAEGDVPVSSISPNSDANRLDALEADNQMLKNKLKQLEDERKKEQFIAAERLGLFDKELAETHVRLSFLQAENEQLINKLEAYQSEKETRRSSSPSETEQDLSARNKALQEKVTGLQTQIDELLAVIQVKEQNEQRLQSTVTSLEVELDRRSGEFARRETDMLSSIATLKRNNTVLSSLLDLMTERAEITQATLDKYLQTLSTPPDIIAGSGEPGASSESPDDSLFRQPADEIQLKVKIISLEKRLSDTEAQMAELQSIRDELEQQLIESDRKIASLEKSESERSVREETLVQELMAVNSKSSSGKNEQLAAAQSLAAENRKLIEARNATEAQLADCREQMRQLDAEVRFLKESINEQKQQQLREIDVLQSSVKEQEDRCAEIDGRLMETSKELAHAREEVKKNKAEFENANKALRDELSQKSEQLKKVEKEAATKAKELQKKEQDLAEKEKLLKGKDQTMFKRDEAIKAHEEAIRQLKIDKTKLQDEVKAKNDEARKLTEQVAKLTEMLNERDERLKEKDSTIHLLSMKLSERERATILLDKEINGLSMKLHEASEKVAERDRDLAKLRASLVAAVKANDAAAVKKVKTKVQALSKASKHEEEVMDSLNKATQSLENEKARLVDEAHTLRNELEHLHKSWQTEREEMQKIIEEKSRMIQDNLEITALMQREIDYLRTVTSDAAQHLPSSPVSCEKEDTSITPAMARRALALAEAMPPQTEDQSVPPTTAVLNADQLKQKMDLATMRVHYENKQSMLELEIDELTSHIARLEFENRSLRLMLEVAQRKVEELRDEYQAERDSWVEEKRALTEEMEHMRSKERIVDEVSKKAQDLEKKLKEAVEERERVEMGLRAEKCQLELKVAAMQAQVNQNEEQKSSGGLLTNKWRQLARTEVRWEKERNDMVKVLDTSRKMIADIKKKMDDAADSQEKERAELKDLFTKEAKEMSIEKMKSDAKVFELKEQNAKLSAACRQLGILQQEVKEERQKWLEERTQLTETVTRSRENNVFFADRIGRVHLATEKLKILLPLVEPEKTAAEVGKDERAYIYDTVKDIISSLAETLDSCRERHKKVASADERSHSIDRDMLTGPLTILPGTQELGALTESADDSVMAISSHQHHQRVAAATAAASAIVATTGSSASVAISEAPRPPPEPEFTQRPYVGSLSDAHLTNRPFTFRTLDSYTFNTLSENRLAPSSLYVSHGVGDTGSIGGSSIGSNVSKQASTQSLADYKRTLNEVSRHLNSSAHRRALARRQFFTEQSGGGVLSGYMSSYSPSPSVAALLASTSPTSTLNRPTTTTTTTYTTPSYIPSTSRSFDQASIGGSSGASSSAVSALGAYSLSRGYTTGLTGPTVSSSSYRPSSAAYHRPDYSETWKPLASSAPATRAGSSASTSSAMAALSSYRPGTSTSKKLSLRFSDFDAPL